MTRPKSILVATDLTDSSDAVLAAAGAISIATGAALHLLHAFDLPAGSNVVGGDLSPANFSGRIAQANKALDAQVSRALPPGAGVASRRVEIYVAHSAIAASAREVAADLIVLGAHGKRRIGDELLGSTADRVIRSADVPCLVVRGGLSVPLRRVLAPVDRSPAAAGALEIAMEWCAELSGGTGGSEPAETSLTVLHVLPQALQIPEFAIDPDEVGEGLHSEVNAARQRVTGASAIDIREEIRWADSVLDEILSFARKQATGLIVTGTHGHGALKRFLIGSVASGLARRAPCSVLLVPPAVWEGEGGDRGQAAA